MKSLNYEIRSHRARIILLTLLCCATVFSYGESKPKKSNLFYTKVVTIKSGMTKEEVIDILSDPYKISFTTNEKLEFIEDLYYKTTLYLDKWYVVTYQCVFVNSKLV